MNKLSLIRVFSLLIIIFTFSNCENNVNETKISKNFDSESHNMGTNCMNCHISGGDGEGWFIVGGTAYDSSSTNTYPNATVKLYTGLNGTGILKATVEVDANGNFYTTDNIDFGTGLFPSITGTNNVTKYMGQAITMGQCNSCHGVSQDKIYVGN